MKRIWSFLTFVLALALLLTLNISGALARLPVVPGVKPPESKYVSGEVLVKFHGAPPGIGHGALRGARAVEYAASLPAQARFALGEIRGKAVRAFPRLGVLQVELPVDLPVPEALEMLKRSGAAEHAAACGRRSARRRISGPASRQPSPRGPIDGTIRSALGMARAEAPRRPARAYR